jgi:hypothetical protein
MDSEKCQQFPRFPAADPCPCCRSIRKNCMCLLHRLCESCGSKRRGTSEPGRNMYQRRLRRRSRCYCLEFQMAQSEASRCSQLNLALWKFIPACGSLVRGVNDVRCRSLLFHTTSLTTRPLDISKSKPCQIFNAPSQKHIFPNRRSSRFPSSMRGRRTKTSSQLFPSNLVSATHPPQPRPQERLCLHLARTCSKDPKGIFPA